MLKEEKENGYGGTISSSAAECLMTKLIAVEEVAQILGDMGR